MRRATVVLILTATVLAALAAMGCGSDVTVSNTGPGATVAGQPASTPGTVPVATVPGGTPAPKSFGDPEEAVTAFLEALARDDFQGALACWAPEKRGSVSLSTNQMKEVVDTEATVNGDFSTVTAKVRYIQCESGQVEETDLHFNVEKSGGGWLITGWDQL